MSGSAEAGRLKIDWARRHMPVLEGIRQRFEKERPLAGLVVSCVLHVEAKTAVLALALRAAGAEVHLAGGNPLSTDDDPVAALLAEGLDTRAQKGESLDEYRAGIEAMLAANPHLIVDDGADLVALAHERPKGSDRIRGSTEETTTGVTRLRALEKSPGLRWPVIDVNDSPMKHLFDNRFGGGQSILDGIFTATNLLVAGRTCVVVGYGWSGRGLASRLRGIGGDVIVTEVDPVKALEARLDGFRVRPLVEAAREADLVVTVTGNRDVVDSRVLEGIKDGCVLANAGHFDVEISKSALETLSSGHRRARAHVEEYTFRDGRRVYLLAEGRLVNLAAGQGHPVEIMDLSFALQALSVEHLARHATSLRPGVLPVPAELDQAVAVAALPHFGVGIDRMTAEQEKYARSWTVGT